MAPFQTASFLRLPSLSDGPGLPLPSSALGTRSVTTVSGLSPRAQQRPARGDIPAYTRSPAAVPCRARAPPRARHSHARRTAWEGGIRGRGHGHCQGWQALTRTAGPQGGERRGARCRLHIACLWQRPGRRRGGGPSVTPRLSGRQSLLQGGRRGAGCLAAAIHAG